jgi:hypothetical protein
MTWAIPKLMLVPMPYLMPWQLLPYAIVKIGMNSIADITNGIWIVTRNIIISVKIELSKCLTVDITVLTIFFIPPMYYIGIGNSIVRNNSIPSYIVKANAYTGQCIYMPPQFDLVPAWPLFFVNVPSILHDILGELSIIRGIWVPILVNIRLFYA